MKITRRRDSQMDSSVLLKSSVELEVMHHRTSRSSQNLRLEIGSGFMIVEGTNLKLEESAKSSQVEFGPEGSGVQLARNEPAYLSRGTT